MITHEWLALISFSGAAWNYAQDKNSFISSEIGNFKTKIFA